MRSPVDLPRRRTPLALARAATCATTTASTPTDRSLGRTLSGLSRFARRAVATRRSSGCVFAVMPASARRSSAIVGAPRLSELGSTRCDAHPTALNKQFIWRAVDLTTLQLAHAERLPCTLRTLVPVIYRYLPLS